MSIIILIIWICGCVGGIKGVLEHFPEYWEKKDWFGLLSCFIALPFWVIFGFILILGFPSAFN
jgi:hypothetical protein